MRHIAWRYETSHSEKDELLFSYEISRQQQTTGWRRYLLMRDHLSLSPTVRLRTKPVKVNSDALLHNWESLFCADYLNQLYTRIRLLPAIKTAWPPRQFTFLFHGYLLRLNWSKYPKLCAFRTFLNFFILRFIVFLESRNYYE